MKPVNYYDCVNSQLYAKINNVNRYFLVMYIVRLLSHTAATNFMRKHARMHMVLLLEAKVSDADRYFIDHGLRVLAVRSRRPLILSGSTHGFTRSVG